MPTESEYFENKREDSVYLSRSIDAKLRKINLEEKIEEFVRPFRIVSKKINIVESHKFIKDGKEVSLRITPNGSQEIKAKFYEDTRGIFTLTIQKYTTETGSPHNTYFTFQGEEILTLFNFIRNIAILPLRSKGKDRFDDDILKDIVLSKEQALELIKSSPGILEEIAKSNITKEEIINFTYRKEQLEIFKRLLEDEDFFEQKKSEFDITKGKEAVWQRFFEENTWIFGYGLNYIFNSPIEEKKLEQVVAGYNFNSSGKRIDALMKTRGIINTFCFGEIKTHTTSLLKKVKVPYRDECWAISDQLAGAISQVQKTVQKSIKEVSTKIDIKDDYGDLTGEQVFLYQPKSYIVIGSLSEFKSEFGINEDKFSSFELFRQSQMNPDIITFDELYERAKYIVETTEDKSTDT